MRLTRFSCALVMGSFLLSRMDYTSDEEEWADFRGQLCLWRARTRRNVGGFHTPGNHTAETALAGWGTWIRNKINRDRGRFYFFVCNVFACGLLKNRNRL